MPKTNDRFRLSAALSPEVEIKRIDKDSSSRKNEVLYSSLRPVNSSVLGTGSQITSLAKSRPSDLATSEEDEGVRRADLFAVLASNRPRPFKRFAYLVISFFAD